MTPARSRPRGGPAHVAFRFLIVLAGTQPLVWRRILVPPSYSFWDLHVAIQDAMGWEDRHLHEFEIVTDSDEPPVRIGIPSPEIPADRRPLAGWGHSVADVFRDHGSMARYLYDFGDDWVHAVIFEGIEPKAPKGRLPRCIGGAGACPPEDCGGPPGYERLLEILADPEHEEYEEMLAWVCGKFDPAAFDPAKVRFDDPGKRFEVAFGERAGEP
ncbi:MAG: plasmid pRiA4b ORF-3 family protein [Candidatus Eisenbacteria bacterium]